MIIRLGDLVINTKTVLLGRDVRAEVFQLASRCCRFRLFENVIAMVCRRPLIGSSRLLFLDSFEFEALVVDRLEPEIERSTLPVRSRRSSNFNSLVISLSSFERRSQSLAIIADLD